MKWALSFCIAILAAFFGAGCMSPPPSVERFEFHETEMGVPFRIVLYAASTNEAASASAAAFARIKQLNDIMTDYDSDSELSRLSQTSGHDKFVPVSPDLWTVLERAQELSRASHGAFDVTVGPYVNLWRYARRQGKLPEPERLEKARRSVGCEKMLLDPKQHRVKLIAPNMRLDLGGIAKGYAVNEAIKLLAERGVVSALVSGGGDIGVSDPPPGKKGWRVELPPLDATNAPPARFVMLKHAGISTSGDLFQRLEINGVRYSHIVDPHTGIGLTDHSLVTVIASDDFAADGLTKIMSVLKPEEAKAFIDRNRSAAARIVRKPGDRVEVYESKRFHKFYERESKSW